MSESSRARPIWVDLLIHLRLNFQIILAPIFLWGFVLAGSAWGWRLVVGFIAVHVGLYGGVTALNSYYDRDEGPVGGLWNPPKWQAAMLPFAWAVQLIGLLMVIPLGVGISLTYIAIVLLSVAYSHPAIRLKGRPIGALLVVAIGQGVGGFLTGWFSATPSPDGLLTPTIIVAIIGISLGTVGLYPLTHIYQTEEDAARGDSTFAVRWGTNAAFRFTLVTFFIAMLCIGWVVWQVFSPVAGALITAAYLVILGDIERWRRRFDLAAVRANYDHVMRLSYVTSLGFAAYLCLQLFL
ncbi:MAG: UbiA family prenyltransferase [Anaerolineae bacterium]